nr:hypothetical protein [Tanacetum cinerariifolium]
MLVLQQAQDVEDPAKDEDDVNEVSAKPTPPSPIPTIPPPPQQENIPSPPQAETAQLSSPPQHQPSQTVEISMTLLNTLLETCATLTKQVANLEQDKDTNEAKPAEVEEVIEVVSTAKLMTEVVTTTATTSTTVQVPKDSAPRKRRGVVIQDLEETATTSVIMHSKNMAGFKIDFFRGMTYNEIRPIFEKNYSLNQAFLERVKEEVTCQEEEGKITKLKQRVRRLEKKRQFKSSRLKRLRKVGTPQRVESLADTVMDDQEDASKQGEIAELDADKDVTLVDVKEDMDVDVQGRLEESQANVYHLDLEHAEKVPSMQNTNEAKPAKVEEVIEVVSIAKLMTEVVTTTATTITTAQVPKDSAPRKRRGVVIQDLKETATTSVIVHSKVKSKDKGKGILVEEPKPPKRQA